MMMHHFYVPVEYNKAPFIAELLVEEYLGENDKLSSRTFKIIHNVNKY